MVKGRLHGVKRSTVKKIFEAAADKDGVCRADIANMTGYSLMTVSKVVDALLEAGILSEKKVKSGTGSSGRRAGMLTLDPERYSAVIDLSGQTFRLCIVDAALNLCDSMTYKYDPHFHYDDNLRVFCKKARTALDRRAGLHDPFGIGIAVPGAYIQDEDRVVGAHMPELSELRLRSTVEQYLERRISLVANSFESAMLSNISALPDHGETVAVYLFVGDTVDGTVIDHGRFIRGAHGRGCDFGKMPYAFGGSLEDSIRACGINELAIADQLAAAAYDLIRIFDPDTFFIESDRVREPLLLIKNIEGRIKTFYRLPNELMPRFVMCGGFRNSVRGVAVRLRDMWIENLCE